MTVAELIVKLSMFPAGYEVDDVEDVREVRDVPGRVRIK